MSTLNPADETGARVRSNTSHFQQNAVEFHSAGTLAEKLSFHFDNGFSGTDNTLQGGQANVQFDDLMANGALNLRAGVYDADVPYLASSRRLTHQDYMIPVTLDATGLELNGTSAGWSYAAALINSSRSQGASDSKTLNNFENVYAWASKEFGSSAATARIYLDREDPRVADAGASPRVEVDLSALLSFDRGEVIPAFTYEKRSDADSAHVEKAQTGMIEALVLLDEAKRWTLTGRVELQHIPGGTLNAEADHSAATLNLAYYLNPNARVGFEWTRLNSNQNAESRTDEVQAFVHVGY
jgi:hypothetical protein